MSKPMLKKSHVDARPFSGLAELDSIISHFPISLNLEAKSNASSCGEDRVGGKSV